MSHDMTLLTHKGPKYRAVEKNTNQSISMPERWNRIYPYSEMSRVSHHGIAPDAVPMVNRLEVSSVVTVRWEISNAFLQLAFLHTLVQSCQLLLCLGCTEWSSSVLLADNVRQKLPFESAEWRRRRQKLCQSQGHYVHMPVNQICTEQHLRVPSQNRSLDWYIFFKIACWRQEY